MLLSKHTHIPHLGWGWLTPGGPSACTLSARLGLRTPLPAAARAGRMDAVVTPRFRWQRYTSLLGDYSSNAFQLPSLVKVV